MNETARNTDAFPAGTAVLDSEEEIAVQLDGVIDDLRAGRPVDRRALVARYPQLEEALDALLKLTPHSALAAPVTRLGPYLIEREIGAGGFGIVYQAVDPDIRRRVAVKVLHPGRLDQPEAMSRFQREACVTARLSHAGIVRLLDYSRSGPPHYLVTELIDGVDPCTWQKRTHAPLHAVVDLVARIAEAVAHAHQQGVCHRDLKPDNILIDAAGAPHILDFGLARVLSADDGSWPTEDGAILGSLAYMAPEQAAGRSRDADARSDVYSLGVILYELITGQPPFSGAPASLPQRILEEEPLRPRAILPTIPSTLEAICLKAMAKRPEQRYASATDLGRDLRSWLGGEAVEARQRGAWTWLSNLLRRRHRDTLTEGWTKLIVLLGFTILAGSSLANYFELTQPPGQRWPFVLATKLIQIAVMLWIAFRVRPLQTPRLSVLERQIWTLVPAYYGAFLTLVIVNIFLDHAIPLAPMLAIFSGMCFIYLGTTFWGWFYVWGAGFFALAVIIALFAPYGLMILGVGWFVAFLVGALHLRASR